MRKLLWSLMALLAFAVAGYAVAIVLFPAARPPFVRDLFAAWPIVAPVHFLGGALAIVLGAFQVNSGLRARYLTIHRWSGRMYLLAVAAAGAAGLAMALTSIAGPVARLGFALLALLWLGTSLAAYLSIRKRDVRAHREWMIRSYALTLAAVTLRIYLPVSLISGIHFMIAYPIIAWMCWVPNLLAAEWLVRSHRAAPIPRAAQ